MKTTFVTSSTLQGHEIGESSPIILSSGNILRPVFSKKISRNKMKIPADWQRFIERYFPATEAGVDSLIKFRRHKRQSIKERKKRTVSEVQSDAA